MNDAPLTYQLDLPSGQLTWSAALQDTYGYPPNEPAITIEWWTEHIHPQDAMQLNQALDNLDDPQSSGWTAEYRLRTGRGDYIRVRDQAMIIRGLSGEPVRIRGTLTPLH